MHDHNVCTCGSSSPLGARACDACGAELYAPAGGLTLWLLEGTSAAAVARLAARLEKRFRREVNISPGRLGARPSRRCGRWKGNSATAFLNQVQHRVRRGDLVLGITENNIVPGVGWNFLFGLAYLDRRCAVMSLHPLRSDGASPRKVLARAEKIAVHELGHALGLDDQSYSHGPCVMCGEVEHDSLETVDRGTVEFCTACAKRIRTG